VTRAAGATGTGEPTATIDPEAAPGANPEGRGPHGPDAPDAGPVGHGGAPPTGRGEWALLVAGAVALAAAVIATRWGDFTPDTRPDVYQQPGRFLSSTVQAWVGGSSGLGQGNFNAGAAPVAAVVWVIRALGAEPWLAVRIWRLLLLLVAAWGIRRYLGALLGSRLTPAARLLVTAFWVANPYVVVAGNTTPILLPYALLPWTMLAFLHASREPRSWRWPAAFALAFFAQTGLNAGVVPFFQLLALPAHLVHARWVERRSWPDLARTVVRCGVLAVAVSLYWLLPSLLASGTGAGIAGATENPRDVSRTASYAESARLLGHWPLYGRSGKRLFLGGYTVYLTDVWVLLASFALPVAAGLALARSRARERLLVVALLTAGLPVMVGLFPPDRPYTAGRLLAGVFDAVPASLAFRTTNKVGAVVVLAYAVAFALGIRAWQLRTRSRGRALRGVVGLVVVAVLAGASAPLWNGGLYPLGYRIPGTWERATAGLDADRPDLRVLVVPGGTGGNYRWGMRSPDDLFPSLLARPVASRNTVVGRGDPAGNLLTWFDTAMAQGALPDGATSTVARYLGAGDVLVRNDLLTEEIGGARPSTVSEQVAADQGLTADGRYGTPGTDTMPGRSGPRSKKAAEIDPADADLPALETYRVRDPEPLVRVSPADHQVLLDGDGEGLVALAGAGILAGTPSVRYLGELSRAELATALSDGARVVLTDTNRRRAWDINRVANATSPTLGAGRDIDAGNGASVTLWPDDPSKQTVSVVTGAGQVSASKPGFGLHPFGRPSQAFDGDPTTAWITGGLGTARGDRITLHLPQAEVVRSVSLLPLVSEPARIRTVSILLGGTRILQPIPPGGGRISVPVPPTRTDEVTVTILDQTPGDNSVGFNEISVDGHVVREVARLPRTLEGLLRGADAETRAAVARAPFDVVLTRQRGSAADLSDDEEAQLDRRFTLPVARTFDFRGELAVTGAAPDLVAAARQGDTRCRSVARLDRGFLSARVVSTARQLVDGRLVLEGCAPVTLAAGDHELQGIFGWRLDRLHLTSVADGTTPYEPAAAGASGAGLSAVASGPTRIEAQVPGAEGPRYLRIGQAFDARWTLLVDGRDAGEPILLDGYSVGWRLDGRPHRLEVVFGPQRAVQVTFVASALAVVGAVAMVALPAPAVLTTRRRRSTARRSAASAAAAGAGPS
jgi:arabinofuranan 3-O-arabinosyltransferase